MSDLTFEPVRDSNKVGQLCYAINIVKLLKENEDLSLIKQYCNESRPIANEILAKHTNQAKDYHFILNEFPSLSFVVTEFLSVEELIRHLSFEENATGVIFSPEGINDWKRCIGIIGHEFTTQVHHLVDLKTGKLITCADLDFQVKRYLGPNSYTYISINKKEFVEPVTPANTLTGGESESVSESQDHHSTEAVAKKRPSVRKPRNTIPKKKLDNK